MKYQSSNFINKIQSTELQQYLRTYISWYKNELTDKDINHIGPISINLDPTSACNFNCPYCVDYKIIKTNKILSFTEIRKYLEFLKAKKLKSVILIGGGEPLLHPDICQIIQLIKELDLELGIVTNGSLLKKIIPVIHLLKKPDWIRLSIDTSDNARYKILHGTVINLEDVLLQAKLLKQINNNFVLGYSYIINQNSLESINEMIPASNLAKKYHFDYISYKPLMNKINNQEKVIIKNKKQLKIIIKQLNHIKGLKILISNTLDDHLMIKKQKNTNICHAQFFRWVLSPEGIFVCPAHRGNVKAFRSKPDEVYKKFKNFQPNIECKSISCFYWRFNNYIEQCIKNPKLIKSLPYLDSFF